MTTDRAASFDFSNSDMTRRALLRGAGSGVLAAGAGGLLAACGGSPSKNAKQGKPKHGGTLRLGASGGGSTDTLDGQNLLTNADYARGFALYEGLTTLNNRGQVENLLAASIEPNASATQWTIRVRPGVVAHNGKPFGAKDVLFSLRRIVAKKLPGAMVLGPIDLAGAAILDPLTVRLPYSKPYGILPEVLSFNNAFMVPEGFNPKTNPIGTGPFKYVSFTPGQQSTFIRNDHYWQHGYPYLDKLVISNIADETAQLNALQAGQVDAIDYLSAASVSGVQSAGGHNIVSETGAWGPFTMRVDRPPFDDVRVRTAMKLLVDRPQMITEVFGGYGTIGNDVWGIFDPDFIHLPQRQQDLEQAKSLLKAAGQSNLRATIITGPNAPGEVLAAQVFATQAKEAGVTINVVQQDPSTYFARSYLKVTFSQDFFPYLPYLVDAGYDSVTNAAYNAPHISNAHYDQLYLQAISTPTNNAKRRAAVHQMLEFDYHEGGNMIPYHYPVIDGVSSRVNGVERSVTGVALGNFNWRVIWIGA